MLLQDKTNVVEFRPVQWQETSEPQSFLATCLLDTLTSKQLVKAKRLAHAIDADANRVSSKLYGCALGELSRYGAEQLISYLEDLTDTPRVSAEVRIAS